MLLWGVYKELLTLGRIRGMYNDKDGFSKLSIDDLCSLRDWLDNLSDEIYKINCVVKKELKVWENDSMRGM